ncbi:MAG: hypothetical protein IKY52_14345 [Clostridia bacterium]|nr:hypothetical protein [Clostridia bacterium]
MAARPRDIPCPAFAVEQRKDFLWPYLTTSAAQILPYMVCCFLSASAGENRRMVGNTGEWCPVGLIL